MFMWSVIHDFEARRAGGSLFVSRNFGAAGGTSEQMNKRKNNLTVTFQSFFSHKATLFLFLSKERRRKGAKYIGCLHDLLVDVTSSFFLPLS